MKFAGQKSLPIFVIGNQLNGQGFTWAVGLVNPSLYDIISDKLELVAVPALVFSGVDVESIVAGAFEVEVSHRDRPVGFDLECRFFVSLQFHHFQDGKPDKGIYWFREQNTWF